MELARLPERFASAFRAAASVHEVQLRELWNSNHAYTRFIRDCLLPEVAGRLTLLHWCKTDYYWLDAVFFERRDAAHCREHETYAESLVVALEHENDAKGTHVEMNKLQMFNAPLKVLVTYDGGRGEEKAFRGLLDRWARITRAADTFGDFETLRQTLVIVGSPGPVWRALIYRGGAYVAFESEAGTAAQEEAHANAQ